MVKTRLRERGLNRKKIFLKNFTFFQLDGYQEDLNPLFENGYDCKNPKVLKRFTVAKIWINPQVMHDENSPFIKVLNKRKK